MARDVRVSKLASGWLNQSCCCFGAGDSNLNSTPRCIRKDATIYRRLAEEIRWGVVFPGSEWFVWSHIPFMTMLMTLSWRFLLRLFPERARRLTWVVAPNPTGWARQGSS